MFNWACGTLQANELSLQTVDVQTRNMNSLNKKSDLSIKAWRVNVALVQNSWCRLNWLRNGHQSQDSLEKVSLWKQQI